MNQRVLTLRNRLHGVMVGVLLTLLYMGNLIHQCGDVERNPGPPKQDPFRQTRLNSGQRRISTDHPVSEKHAEEPTLKDVISILNSKFDDLKHDMADLKASNAELKRELQDMRQAVQDLKKENHLLKEENGVLKKRFEDLENKTDDLEGRSKRNNLIFHGIPRREKETWQDCEDLINDVLTDKLEMTDTVQFDRVHRLNASSTSPIIACCTLFKDKQKILKEKKKLKGTSIFVGEDFSFKVRETRKKLTPHLKSAWTQGKRATMVFNHLVIEGKRFVLDADDNLVQAT